MLRAPPVVAVHTTSAYRNPNDAAASRPCVTSNERNTLSVGDFTLLHCTGHTNGLSAGRVESKAMFKGARPIHERSVDTRAPVAAPATALKGLLGPSTAHLKSTGPLSLHATKPSPLSILRRPSTAMSIRLHATSARSSMGIHW